MDLTDKDTGMLRTTAITVSGDYTVTDIDDVGFIYVSTGASDVTIFMPQVFGNPNTKFRKLFIYKIDSGTGSVTIEGYNYGTGNQEYIDDKARVYLGQQNTGMTIKADASGTFRWRTLARVFPQIIVEYVNGVAEDVVAIGPGAAEEWLPGQGKEDLALVGVNAGRAISGKSNSGIGEDVMEFLNGKHNAAAGEDSLRRATCDYCDASGVSSLYANEGNFCSGGGNQSLRNNLGRYCIGNGANSGANNTEDRRLFINCDSSDVGDDALITGSFSQSNRWLAINGDLQIRNGKIVPQDITTTDDTPTYLVGDRALVVPASTAWMFTAKVSAYNNDDETAAGFFIKGLIRRDSANNTVIVNSTFPERWHEGDMSDCEVVIEADDTTESLVVKATGLAGKNIVWNTVIDIA